MTVKPIIEDLINKFHARMDKDEGLRNELNGMRKRVQLDLDSEQYHFVLEKGRISGLSEGVSENPDITVQSDPDTFRGLVDGSIKPMKALALRKIKLKGSIEDILRLRHLF